jgi:hypothetical protein
VAYLVVDYFPSEALPIDYRRDGEDEDEPKGYHNQGAYRRSWNQAFICAKGLSRYGVQQLFHRSIVVAQEWQVRGEDSSSVEMFWVVGEAGNSNLPKPCREASKLVCRRIKR